MRGGAVIGILKLAAAAIAGILVVITIGDSLGWTVGGVSDA